MLRYHSNLMSFLIEKVYFSMPCEYSEKIAIFGSAFNPPTLGHLSVLERLTHFDRILLLPSYHMLGGNLW